MREFAPVNQVQLAAIDLLVCIAMKHTQHPEFFRTSVAGVLVDVMEAQSHEKHVQSSACKAMG